MIQAQIGLMRGGDFYDVPIMELGLDQKMIINRIIKEVSAQRSNDIQVVLKQPTIQNILRNEFSMDDKEIKKIEDYIITHCQSIINNSSYNNLDKSIASQPHSRIGNSAKPLPLSSIHHYPVQPCLKSLYYISKIAQSQQIRIVVPPTVLIGFNNDNRMIYTDLQTGFLQVSGGYVSPKVIQKFIDKHIASELESQSPADKLIFPKFVIKLMSKNSNSNEVKLYYSRESMMADLMSYWGTYNLALQIYIKPKHLRPQVYRYYMKNNNIYKAVCITNQENLQKDSPFYQGMLAAIQELSLKSQGEQTISKDSNSSKSPHRRDGIILPHKQTYNLPTQINRKGSLKRLPRHELTLDKGGFPKTLESFPLEVLFSTYQTTLATDDIRNYFTVSTDNYENLTMMNIRPSALPQAEQMTIDLQRLYSQYYLQTKKYGPISHFVCDFMENDKGLIQLLQIKSFECQDCYHNAQKVQRPLSSFRANTIIQSATIDDTQPNQEESVCKASIMCADERYSKLKDLFQQTCADLDMWIFTTRKGCIPKMSHKIVDKYHKELHIGKDSFLLSSEKAKITPLFPLATFCDYQKERSLIHGTQDFDQFEINQSVEHNGVPCCYHCYKILELFSSRYYSLVFKTETTVEELRRLKLKLYTNWGPENMRFLLSVYKDSKKVLSINTDIEQHEKRVKLKQIIERSKTPDSIFERNNNNYQAVSNLAIQSAVQSAASIQRSNLRSQVSMRQQSEKLIKTKKNKKIVINSCNSLEPARTSPRRSIQSARTKRNSNISGALDLRPHPLISETYSLLADAISRPLFSHNNINAPIELNFNLLYPEAQGKNDQTDDMKSQRSVKQNLNDKEIKRLRSVYNLKLDKYNYYQPASRNSNQQQQQRESKTIGGASSSGSLIGGTSQNGKPSQTLTMLRQQHHKQKNESDANDYFNNKRSLHHNQNKLSGILKSIKTNQSKINNIMVV